MADKAQPTDAAATSPAVADESQPAAPTPPAPRRSPGHRGQDVRDTMAEMAARAHEISLEAGSRMTSTIRDVINAAAGLAGFAVESARDLVQYMVRRGQMTQDEADKLIREAEEAYNKRKPEARGADAGSVESNGASRSREAKGATATHAAPHATHAAPAVKKAAEPPAPPRAAVAATKEPAAAKGGAPAKPAAKGAAKAPAKAAPKAPAAKGAAKSPAKSAAKSASAAKGAAKTASKGAAKKAPGKKR
jgi:hypothetical protein